MKKEFFIPNEIMEILNTLLEKGIFAYPVGGCVRDFLMGREVNDYDVAAECTPEELKVALENYRCSFEGFDFGTVRVHTENYHTEITCCRSEGAYHDHRKPDSVEYTRDIISDLARRDFTVNAMAYDVSKKEIIDPFEGREDIAARSIRCVGEPEVRFAEDALRILRAIRFSSTLGFEVEKSTAEAAVKMQDTMKTLSGERVFAELEKLIMGLNVLEVMLKYSSIICTVIPELYPCVGFEQHNPHHKYTVYEHISCSVAACPADRILRFTMLFHDVAKPAAKTEDDEGIYHFKGHPEMSAETAEKVLRRLKADNSTISRVKFLIKYHDVRPEPTKKSIHRYLCKVGYEGARQLLSIRRADLSAHSSAYFSGFEIIDRCEALIDELEKEDAATKVSDLKVDGKILMESLSIAPGPLVGKVLAHLLEKVSSDEIINEKDPLLKAAKDYIEGVQL